MILLNYTTDINTKEDMAIRRAYGIVVQRTVYGVQCTTYSVRLGGIDIHMCARVWVYVYVRGYSICVYACTWVCASVSRSASVCYYALSIPRVVGYKNKLKALEKHRFLFDSLVDYN